MEYTVWPVLADGGVTLASTLSALVVNLLFAWWGSNIAESKGKSPGFGALVGFFCNCIGIVFLYLLPE